MDIEAIYKEYGNKVRAYISSRVSNASDVDDLQSEVFLKIQNKASAYEEEKAAVSTWIYTITHNAVIDYYRRSRVTESIDAVTEGELTPSQLIVADETDRELLKRETLKELAEALKTLSDEERQVIVYHYYDGLTLQEISKKIGFSYGQVKLRHASALKVMNRFFTKELPARGFHRTNK